MKIILKCQLCKEDVHTDLEEIWCACHIQKLSEFIIGESPSFWESVLNEQPMQIAIGEN